MTDRMTLGKAIREARRQHNMRMEDLCKELTLPSEDEEFITADLTLLSRIENSRVDVRLPEFDWLVPRIAAIFHLDTVWLNALRQQTEVEPPTSLEEAVRKFPIYFSQRQYDL